MDSSIPFDQKFLDQITAKYPTPFHIYDEAHMRATSKNLYEAMQKAGFKNFKNYFAVKALPNPYIMAVLAEEGQGMDASSIAELELCKMANVKDVMFSSNNTSDEEFSAALQDGAIINFDDITHVRRFLKKFGAPKVACCRYNPGNLRLKGGEDWIIGTPQEAKYGMPKEHILEAYKLLKKAGSKTFGLHTMLLSNDLSWQSHIKIAEALFDLASEISEELAINLDFINLGGGLGVTYKLGDKEFDLDVYAKALKAAYDKRFSSNQKPNVVMENGRYITASSGYLVTRVINRKETHKTYIGVDASMANLMRPGMYGAYHHITILNAQGRPEEVVDVTGSLCENNDKFAINRKLPKAKVGDYLIIHTTGAHGHAMGFQYNGKLRSAELLLRTDKTAELIRRAETLDDYFATLDFKKEK